MASGAGPTRTAAPDFSRVDTVHQGDWDGAKGVYHINAVDTVTQWQVVGCASKISEAYLLPVLKAVLAQFPFVVLGFHVDNGSEYINYRVANMLEKLHAEFTKSRACRSQDNALVEGKNGAVVRKLIGYGYIAGEHAEAIGKFYTRHLNPYLNFHRPCGFATVSLDERGKRRRQYKTEDYRTPLEKLKSLERAEQYLKAGSEPGGVGTRGAGDERHRVRTTDECRQVAAAAAMQSAVPATAAVPHNGARRAVEMPGPWKAWKSKSSFPTLSTAPWKSRKDREIPTFPQPGVAPDGKVENQKQVSHFPTRRSRRRPRLSFLKPKPKKGSRPLRGPLIPLSRSPYVDGTDFMLILRLENAGARLAALDLDAPAALSRLALAFWRAASLIWMRLLTASAPEVLARRVAVPLC